MKIDREKAQKVFENYINEYDLTKDMIRLKAEHTFRVSRLCEEIARSLELSKEETDLAWLIGLLHDLGRFEQQKVYGTFNDAISIDHAKYGAELLFGNRDENGTVSPISIRDFTVDPSEDEVIRTAVYYHSAYRLPEDLDERTGMFCNLIRDADKIDIIRVNVEFPLEEIYHISRKELYGGQVSEAVMDSFEEGHAVLRSLKKTGVDNVVGHISLFFELVYPKSRQIMREQGYLDRLMNFSSENPVTRAQFARIREKMNREYGF